MMEENMREMEESEETDDGRSRYIPPPLFAEHEENEE